MEQQATVVDNGTTAAHRLLSDLPSSIFENLQSPHRAANTSQMTTSSNDNDLRQQILSKLSHAEGNDKADTVRDLLKISDTALLRILDPLLTILECRRFITRVHTVCAVRPCSALQVSQSTSIHNSIVSLSDHSPRQFSGKISTGLSTIDNYLRGGFATGSIAEVVGRAGVGKTHLAQQLCVLAATTMSDCGGGGGVGGGGAIFIDTENKLSLHRLKEIALNRSRKEQSSSEATVGIMSPDDIAIHVLENVTVRSLLSTKELLETLDELRLEITQRNTEAETSSRLPVRLLVIDSIAAPIRRDFDMMSSTSSGSSGSVAAQRAAALLQIASKLKQLASDFNLAVVVINQVGVASGNSNKQQGDYYQRNDTLDIRDGEFTASLGTAWQYCVSTKIILEHDDDPHKQRQHGHVSARTATIAKSILSRRAQVEFQVTNEGLCEGSN